MRQLFWCLTTLLFLALPIHAKIYFKETFDDLSWQSRWKFSTATSAQSSTDTHPTAKFVVGTGQWYGDALRDKGFHTTKDAHMYAASAKLDSPLSLSVPGRSSIVIQYSVKNEQAIECGGAFIKLFPGTLQPDRLSSKSHYVVQFGPDYCGTQTRDVTLKFHLPAAILNEQQQQQGGVPAPFTQALFTLKNKIRARQDHLTHTYTLVLNADHTFQILIDGQVAYYENGEQVSGNLMDHLDWQSNLPAEQRIEGKAAPTKVDVLDQLDAQYIGFELWQVKSGTVFDNIIVTDSLEEANQMRIESEKTRGKESELWQQAYSAQQQEAARIRQQTEDMRAKQDQELAQAQLRQAQTVAQQTAEQQQQPQQPAQGQPQQTYQQPQAQQQTYQQQIDEQQRQQQQQQYAQTQGQPQQTYQQQGDQQYAQTQGQPQPTYQQQQAAPQPPQAHGQPQQTYEQQQAAQQAQQTYQHQQAQQQAQQPQQYAQTQGQPQQTYQQPQQQYAPTQGQPQAPAPQQGQQPAVQPPSTPGTVDSTTIPVKAGTPATPNTTKNPTNPPPVNPTVTNPNAQRVNVNPKQEL